MVGYRCLSRHGRSGDCTVVCCDFLMESIDAATERLKQALEQVDSVRDLLQSEMLSPAEQRRVYELKVELGIAMTLLQRAIRKAVKTKGSTQ